MQLTFSFKKMFIGLLLVLSTNVSMAAGPIMHAYLADKWIHTREHYTSEQKGSFIRGTLFPDIRYLGVLSRKETHIKEVSLQDLKSEKNPFIKGTKFHAFVDEEREKMVVKWGVYDKLKNIPGQSYISTFLKMLEDEILYQDSNWSDVKEYLTSLDEDEKHMKVSTDTLVRWHKMLIDSFNTLPSKQFERLSKRDKYFLNVPPKVVKRWSKILPVLAQDPEMRLYVSDLVKHFDIALNAKHVN